MFDSFANNWQVEQAYAQILTHPGAPSVYWKHYFEWGSDLQNKSLPFPQVLSAAQKPPIG
jgi:hypothetical protein